MHCPGALSHSTVCSSDPDQGRVDGKWSLNADQRSALDLDPRSPVESPCPKSCFLFSLCSFAFCFFNLFFNRIGIERDFFLKQDKENMDLLLIPITTLNMSVYQCNTIKFNSSLFQDYLYLEKLTITLTSFHITITLLNKNIEKKNRNI